MLSLQRETLLRMDASFCPNCSHCHRKKELEIARLEREEREAVERLAEEKRQERAAAKKLVEQGVIHGKDFDAYTIEEIRNIQNYDFLEEMSANVYPAAQPWDEYEMDNLSERAKAVREQMYEVLLNEME